MTQLHRSADKLITDADHLKGLLVHEADLNESEIEVYLSVAKRVRRESTILVRHLAALRDQLQP